MEYGELESLYNKYAMSFAGEDGTLPPMMALKLEHTAKVVENARLVAAGERLAPREAALAEAAALLHDTGRYEQLRRYGTFRDSESVDHAEFSYSIVKERGWLETWPAEDAAAVLDAVRHHNKRELPPGLPPLAAAVARVVRDADKLDIFRVLEERVRTTDWRNDSAAFWGLAPAEKPSPGVVRAILEERPVDYGLISSLADFTLVQVGWMVSGLCHATSRRLCAARGHLEFRERFLAEITGPAGRTDVEAVCEKARAVLAGEHASK